MGGIGEGLVVKTMAAHHPAIRSLGYIKVFWAPGEEIALWTIKEEVCMTLTPDMMAHCGCGWTAKVALNEEFKLDHAPLSQKGIS
jgi:hypothetical protein